MNFSSLIRYLLRPWPGRREREAACREWAARHYPGPDEIWIATTVEILVEQVGLELSGVSPTSRFIDDLKVDEETVELVMALEEEFGIEIQDEDASRLETFDDLVNYLRPRVAPRFASG